MVVVRNVFRLKFGKAREALPVFKEAMAMRQRGGGELSQRLLTDVTGPFYTVVLELTAPSLAEFEALARETMGTAEWRANYEKLTPLVDSGYREIFNVVQ